MNTSQQLVVNKLPTRTWNHLNVNEATIPWNAAETADIGTDAYEITAENQAQPLHIRLTGAEGHSRKHIAVEVAPVCRQRCIWCWIRRTASPWKRR